MLFDTEMMQKGVSSHISRFSLPSCQAPRSTRSNWPACAWSPSPDWLKHGETPRSALVLDEVCSATSADWGFLLNRSLLPESAKL